MSRPTPRFPSLCAGLLALAALPAWAQTPPAQNAALTGPNKDVSIDGNARQDTQVLQPKNGETISIRVPTQGLLFIGSLIPWAINGEKEAAGFVIKFNPRGISIQHIAGSAANPAKGSFTLRLLDGRVITVNIRTGHTKFQTAYAIIV
jgi:hypothetical protein